MPSTSELLQAITGMQQNAQANLPVIPNNGNPQGANNMPAGSTIPTPATGNNLAWLQPSASMDYVKQLLSQPLHQGTTAAPVPPTTGVVPRPNDQMGGPVLPQRNNNWRDQRQEMRAAGDFVAMPKLGHRQISGVEPQQLLPAMPMRGQGF